MKKMRTTIEHRFEHMKKEVREELKKMMVPTKEKWVNVFEKLKKEKNLSFYSAHMKIENITINGEKKEVTVIYHEQSTDYIIVFHQIHEDKEKKVIHIDFYSFDHYYNEDDYNDYSLAKKVIKNDNIHDYQPIYTIHHTSFKDDRNDIDVSGSDHDIYQYGKLDSLSITYSGMMRGLFNEEGMNEEPLSNVSDLVRQTVREIALGQKRKIAKIHDELQESKKVGKWEMAHVNARKECARPALICKKEDIHYLILVEYIENDEYEEAYDLCFHACHNDHEFLPKLEDLMNNYEKYKARPIYKINYTHTKSPRERVFDVTGLIDDAYRFSRIEGILTEIERTQF